MTDCLWMNVVGVVQMSQQCCVMCNAGMSLTWRRGWQVPVRQCRRWTLCRWNWRRQCSMQRLRRRFCMLNTARSRTSTHSRLLLLLLTACIMMLNTGLYIKQFVSTGRQVVLLSISGGRPTQHSACCCCCNWLTHSTPSCSPYRCSV